MMTGRNKRGQSMVEYAILLAVVIVCLVFMMSFFGRHVKGNVMSQAKSVSEDPWGEGAVFTSNSNSTSNTVSNASSSATNSNSNSNTGLTLTAVP